MSKCTPSPTLSRNDEKLIRSLSLKKFRDAENLFIIEGEKSVDEALASPLEVIRHYRASDIGAEAMKRISQLSTPSPALAVIRKPEAILSPSAPFPPQGISLALDSVRDPGNLGTIIRLCDWFGIENIFASPDTVDAYNPKTVQASMGAILRKQINYTNLCSLTDRFSESGIPVYGTFLGGDDIYAGDIDRKRCLIIMGSESFGISEALASKVTKRLYIPPYPTGVRTSESLNVAIATAILCYEIRRP
ncbi:MAG: RNA methyltransferase [Alistipes sp.]|nr:RNA methyltransferase [Candidatus Minthomonas equi]